MAVQWVLFTPLTNLQLYEYRAYTHAHLVGGAWREMTAAGGDVALKKKIWLPLFQGLNSAFKIYTCKLRTWTQHMSTWVLVKAFSFNAF